MSKGSATQVGGKLAVGLALASATMGLLFFNPGLSHAGECPNPIIWKEDFEDESPGQFPEPHWSYTGNSDIKVDDSKSAVGNQSLRVHASPGGCWEAIPCRLLEVSTSEGFTIEFYIYISSDHREGCHPGTGGAGLVDVCDWTRAKGVGIIWFEYDGSINSRIGNLGTYTYDTWYKVKMKYERENPSTVRLSYWIDDVFKGTQSVPVASYEDDLKYFHFSSQDGTIWADEIEFRCNLDKVCDPSIDIILNDADLTPGETLTATAHVTNDDNPDKVEVKVWIELPNGHLKSIYNIPSYHIPAGVDMTVPLFSHTFTGSEPAGAYQFGGRFLNIINGDIFCEDAEPFTFTP